jgi:hypothetical protein
MPSSYRILQLNSQAERLELGKDVGDTPLCVRFLSNNLEGIWADIISKTQQDGFEDFRGAFLVTLGQWSPAFTSSTSFEGAWKTLMETWDGEMDMNYIPTETLEVRTESQYGLGD